MKTLIKIVLPMAVLGLLGGCGSQTKSHSASKESKTTEVAKPKTNSSSSSSSTSDSSTKPVAESSAQSEQPSEKRQNNQTTAKTQAKTQSSQADVTQSHPAVTQQMLASRISRLLSGQYAPQDLSFQFNQAGSGIYTVQVQENHQSPNMKAKGADPSTSPTIAWFKTNAKGQLLKSVDGGVNYVVVGNAY
ncbi:MAG TPA: hypothetical protein DDW71_02195 [Lactobacillus sp.]|nr:hypothetical protein [Lactobacillus sp.]